MRKLALLSISCFALAVLAQSCRSISDAPQKRPRVERHRTQHFSHVQPVVDIHTASAHS